MKNLHRSIASPRTKGISNWYTKQLGVLLLNYSSPWMSNGTISCIEDREFWFVYSSYRAREQIRELAA